MRFAQLIGWIVLLAPGAAELYAQGGTRLYKRPVSIPEIGEVAGYVLTQGANRFFFIPPPGWSLQPDLQENRIICRTRELDASLVLSLIQPSPFDGEKPVAEQAEARIKSRFPKADIESKFESHTISGKGATFDVRYTVQSQFRMKSRIAYIVFDQGVAEFNLTCKNSQFDEFHHAFGYFLSSFRINDFPENNGQAVEGG